MAEEGGALHTLDPWIAERHAGGSFMVRSGHVLAMPGAEVAVVFRELDAKLIQAVPEMLKALMAVRDRLSNTQGYPTEMDEAFAAMEKPVRETVPAGKEGNADG